MSYSQITQHSAHTVVNMPRISWQVERNFTIASSPEPIFFIGEGMARLELYKAGKIQEVEPRAAFVHYIVAMCSI